MPAMARTKLDTMHGRSTGLWLVAFTALLPFGGAPAAHAQQFDNAISQPMVQPLPSPGVSRLKTALRRLARNSRDVEALADAGEASLEVNDLDAAVGFFGRAEDLSPDNPRVKAGLAAAFVRQQRPLEALKLFDEAQAAGASTNLLAGDRALAYDLVGDNNTAMGFYRQALSQTEDAATRRRFALSHAISGDRRAFEAVLAPLIKQQDPASYRARAFGLAILGEKDEAVAITEAVMPKHLSARIAPYLGYMPRLTKAQQAAAANFGSFPRAAQIGRDIPQIAQYGGRDAATRNADARLAPQGEPLGRRADAASQRRRPDRGRSAVTSAAPATVTSADIRQAARADRAAASDPMARTRAPRRVRVKRNPDAVKPEALVEVPKPKEQAAQQVAASATPAATPPTVEVVKPKVVAAEPATQIATTAVSTNPLPKPIEQVDPAPSKVAAVTDTAFDLGKVSSGQTTASTVEPVPGTPKVVAEAPTKVETPASVAEAFADFSLPPRETVPTSSGVDITKITPKREIANKPEAEPKKPAHPKRFWVQIATGKDRNALKFDWRRFSRKAPDVLGDLSPQVTTWGESYRLLAGPYSSAKEARSAMNSLKESGVDGFNFTSAEGQEIESP